MSTENQNPTAAEPTLTDPNLTPRASTACVECRTRKTRCDSDGAAENQPCSNCVRFNYVCSNAIPSVTRPSRSASGKVDKRRIQTACQWCRKNKSRCSGELPCEACRLRNQTCEYPANVRRFLPTEEQSEAGSGLPRYDLPGQASMQMTPLSNLQPGQIYQAPAPAAVAGPIVSHPPPQPVEDEYCLGLDKEVIEEYIEAFFRFVYPVSCMGFLHQATFLRQWHTRTIQLSLLKAVCSCALQVFSASHEDSERATEWMRQVELDALHNIGDLTIPRLQILTLLTFFEFTYRVHSKKVLMFMGLAARLSFAKRLNYEDATLSVVEQESRRRLMWSIFVLDKFCSGGLAELMLCPPEHMHVRLPANEQAFGYGSRTETQFLYHRPETTTNGTTSGTSNKVNPANIMDEFAYTVRILDLLRSKIHKFTKRVVASNEGLYASAQEFQALDAEIDVLDLPANLKWTKQNLLERVYSSNLSSFVMLHTWRLQCKCDLYRLTIPRSKDCISDTALQSTPYEYAQNMRLKCLSHVIELTRVWADVLDIGLEKPVHDPAIAGCAHQCAKILTLITNQTASVGESQENRMSALLVCQMILEPLKDIYPKAKIHYDDVCRMRSLFNVEQSHDFPAPTDRQDMMIDVQSTNDEQVRNLLGQFNG